MNYFLTQYQYNLEILLNNVSKKYNINKKELFGKFYPKNIPIKLKNKIKEIINKKLCLYNDTPGEIINSNYFLDKNNNLYFIVNSGHFKYNNFYDAIKI